MHELVRLLAAPFVRSWAVLAMQNHTSIPRPTDRPHSHAPGPDGDRVLLFGSGPASGWGVRSHDLALPGSLARALSSITGRGADVSVSASPFGSIRQAPDDVAARDLAEYHAVVVVLGVIDAVDFISPLVWKTEMVRLLSQIPQQAAPRAHLYVLGIQPIRTIPIFDNLLFGTLANWHAATLNAVTVRLCAAAPRTTFVSLTDRPFIVAGRYRTSTDYRDWGKFLATEMAADLTEASLSRR